MKRIVKLSAGFVALSAAYVATLRSSDLKGRDRIVVALLPLAAVACFGLYALVTLLVGVATFRDVPEANGALQKDIAEARRDLERRGVVSVVASD